MDSQKKKQEAIHLLNMVRKNREELKQRRRESEREVRRRIRERLEQNERKKKEKENIERERHLKIVNDIIYQGGLCTTKESLDQLLQERNKTENLKAQIRYRKIILNQKNLILSGTYNELYESLTTAISNETNLPPRKKRRL